MSKVFLWKSYGTIEVYAVDTHAQRVALYNEIYSVIHPLLYEEDAEEVDEYCSKNAEIRPVSCINYLLEVLGDGQDMFENGTGFEEVKVLTDE